uniref:Ig-like domain-containing protein n=1 Tax=Pelusios castaneus TaxID=367368 RepID=A0A8C8SH45_9SAUR
YWKFPVVSSCGSLICPTTVTHPQQLPSYSVVGPGTLQSVTCTLKDTAYPWMSWYLQEARGQLHFLVQSGTKDDQEEILWGGTSYRSKRVSNLELTLEMKNVTQSQTIYCTCSKEHSERSERRW